MAKHQDGVRTFSAFDDLDDDDVLEPVPFRLQGRLLRPIPATVVPDEVAAKLQRWASLKKTERAELRAEHDLVTTWQLDLEAVAVAPSGVLDDLARSVMIDEVTKKQIWNAVSLNRFMEGVLLDEHVAAFQELSRDKNRLLPIEVLGDTVMWLAGQLTDERRPTQPSSG